MPRVPRIARRMGRKLSAPGSKPSVVLFVPQGRPLRPPASRRNQHFVVAGGEVAPPVVRDGGWDVEALPAQVLQPPGEVRVLAIQKEVGIEDPRRDARRVQRFPPVEPGRAARAENLLFLEITAALLLSRAA